VGVLNIGTTLDGRKFTLPGDLSDRKIALLAQSKKGKTYGLGDILEELAVNNHPFIAGDPAQNLWGLRVLPDGRPSGLQVVVFGGPHGDLPFEKDQGDRLAELLVSEPTCAVIDVSFESGNASKKFWTDFAGRLMRIKPDVPPLVVLEEGSTLIPQNAIGMQSQLCKSAVSKVATIGGNFGYGVLVADQRPAKIDKDVLSQCDALIVMGITHKKDRTTIREWIEAKDVGDQAEQAFQKLGSLQPGEAWYWSPGEDRFEQFKFRKRRTLHPREMQRLGLKSGKIQLGELTAFVERAKRELTKTVSGPEAGPRRRVPHEPEPPKVSLVKAAEFDKLLTEKERLAGEVDDLRGKLSTEQSARRDAEGRLEAVRTYLKPQYESLQKLFDRLPVKGSAGAVDPGSFAKWLDKAPKLGMKIMLEHLIENGEATRQQLATIAGVAKSTAYDYVKWILRNQLAQKDGDRIVLRKM
jgi:hypothetical protein